MYHCPRCNAPIIPGSPYCTNCHFNFAAAQFAPNQVAESKREKRYRTLLIVLAVFFIFDGIVWNVIGMMADKWGYEVYDWIDPYRWLVTPAYAALPAVVGLMLPKSTPWRLILIIGGSIWFVFRMYEFIRQLMEAKDFVFFEF